MLSTTARRISSHASAVARAGTAAYHAPAGTLRQTGIVNEPFLHYKPGSPERVAAQKALDRMLNECPDIPCVVGGKEIRTSNPKTQTMPTDHQHVLCTWHQADKETLLAAADAAVAARKDWEARPLSDRQSVYLKAADLLSTKYRGELAAAVMLGQGKNFWQAEIDAGVELIDFWRFGCEYASQIHGMQPPCTDKGVWNKMEYRSLEGFVVAITPFNFIAIGGNLHSSPSIMGNTCVWKPSSTAMLGSWTVFNILREAGLPDGVLNFAPGRGADVGSTLIQHPDMAGLHFTGGTSTFNTIYREIANNLENYKTYPRIVGETGGKNFHFIHESADVDTVVNCTVRGAFEYAGQKCSATSRMYVPSNIWPEMKEKLVAATEGLTMGCVTDPTNLVNAVIDGSSFKNIVSYIEHAKAADDCTIIAGGSYDDSKGWFVRPTIIETTNPNTKSMAEEIFGPVLSVYVYDPADFEETLKLCDATSPYALTGSIFATDVDAISTANSALWHACGNFYINDKSTGSIVGQQPFGGARLSGTNDKSGSSLNLLRWTSARSTKEQFLPCDTIAYPSNEPDN